MNEERSQNGNLSLITFALDIKFSELHSKKRKAADGAKTGDSEHPDKKALHDSTALSKPKCTIKVDMNSCFPEVLTYDTPSALLDYFKNALIHKLLGNKFVPTEEEKVLNIVYQELGDFDVRKLEHREDTGSNVKYNPETIIRSKEKNAQNILAANKALYDGIKNDNTSYTQRFLFPQNTGEITLSIQQATINGEAADDMQKLPVYLSDFFDSLEAWLTAEIAYLNFQVEEKSPSSMHN